MAGEEAKGRFPHYSTGAEAFRPAGVYGVVCKCGWSSEGHSTPEEAEREYRDHRNEAISRAFDRERASHPQV